MTKRKLIGVFLGVAVWALAAYFSYPTWWVYLFLVIGLLDTVLEVERNRLLQDTFMTKIFRMIGLLVGGIIWLLVANSIYPSGWSYPFYGLASLSVVAALRAALMKEKEEDEPPSSGSLEP